MTNEYMSKDSIQSATDLLDAARTHHVSLINRVPESMRSLAVIVVIIIIIIGANA